MDKVKVLYIDDQLLNLAAFKASFRRDFEIFTAKSADEGKEILKKHPIEVVLSDQKMPGKTGVDFFEEIKELHPTPMRILITAYSDIKSIIDAINKGNIYRYVTKPWNNYELKLTIENAYKLYKLAEDNTNLNSKYKKIFSESTDSIILVDKDFKIIDSNRATLDLTGSLSENLNFSSFIPYFNDESKAQEIITIIKEKKVLADYECQLLTVTGEIITCLISGNVITNSYGEFMSYQLIIKNITQRSKMNQLLLKKIIETQENERERISRDLHDGIGQSLVAIKLHWKSLEFNYNQNISIESELKTIPTILQDTIVELRRVCFNTLPLVLKEYGLIKGVKELQSNIEHENFNVIFDYSMDFPPISKTLEISIFRIIQEFTTNSIKHSKASEIRIELSIVKKTILLNLKDNGIGFNINDLENFKGHGIKNIKNRIESINGELEINSVINSGTEFYINFPTY